MRNAIAARFFTTRFVEAQDEHDAEHNALAMVYNGPKLKDALNDPSDPPVIYCESIAPMEAFRSDVVQPGFSFYLTETDA